MNTTPQFSIITVVYNDAVNLEKTIKSVISQTYRNYEYIVIDGGSKDNTLDIIRKYQHCITLWKSEPDKGIYDAMNKGVLCAKGEFINFLNAGDTYYTSTVLQQIADENTRQDSVEIIYGQAVRLSSASSQLKFIKGDKITTSNLFTSVPFCHQAIFYKTSTFREIGPYNYSYKVTADYQWLIRYYNSRQYLNKIHFVPSSLVEYVEGGYSFKNIHRAAQEKLKIARTDFDSSHRPIGILYFSCFYVKAYLIEWLGKLHILESYRHVKYRFLKRTVTS
jgi:glycosyltransferase involved in cell wall biosynthesis